MTEGAQRSGLSLKVDPEDLTRFCRHDLDSHATATRVEITGLEHLGLPTNVTRIGDLGVPTGKHST